MEEIHLIIKRLCYGEPSGVYEVVVGAFKDETEADLMVLDLEALVEDFDHGAEKMNILLGLDESFIDRLHPYELGVLQFAVTSIKVR